MADIAELGIRVDSSPATKAAKELDALTQSAMRADDAAQDLAATSKGSLGAGMSAGGQQSRMLAMQLSQVAQQASATGNFVQALAIQLPDMAMGFGAVGIAAGVLASVTLPLLASAFGGTSQEQAAAAEAANRLKEAWDALAEAGRATQAEIDKLRFGVDEAYQVDLLREQIRLREEINAKVLEGQTYLATTTDSLDRQRVKAAEYQAEIDKLADTYRSNQAALDRQAERTATLAVMEGVRVQRANEIKAKQEETAKAVADVEAKLRAAGISAETLASMNFSNIDQARAFAEGLAGALQAASAYAAELSATGQSSGPDAARTNVQFGGPIKLTPSGAGMAFKPSFGGGGGGGGGADPYADNLQALIENLRSQREIEDEWYQESLQLLNDRRAQEILGKQAHDQALIDLHQEYQRRIAEIDAEAAQQRISDTANLFGALASVAQAGGQKTAKLVATFQAIEGTVNAYGAAIKALNTPGLTLAGRFAAYASVLAAGLKGVAAIRAAGGVSGGGGTGGSIAAQGATTQQGGTVEYIVKGLDKNALYTGEMISQIFDGMMEEAQKRGLQTAVRFI
jgi:hypothetical protein